MMTPRNSTVVRISNFLLCSALLLLTSSASYAGDTSTKGDKGIGQGQPQPKPKDSGTPPKGADKDTAPPVKSER